MKKFLKSICIALVAIVTGVAITACKPGSVEKAKEKMESAGYVVMAYENDDNIEGFVGGFIAMNISAGESMIAILFESKSDAEKFAELNAKTEYGEAKVEGKWLFAGSEGAIEAFKK